METATPTATTPAPPRELMRLNQFFRRIHPANGAKNQSRRLHVLTELSAQPGMLLAEIGQRVGMKKTSINVILHHLHRQGMVTMEKEYARQPSTAPSLKASLTPLGQKTVDQLTPYFRPLSK